MRKVIVVTLGGLAVVVVVVLYRANGGMSPDAQRALQAYGPGVVVETAVFASRPQGLTADLSHKSFGDSYFQNDNLNLEAGRGKPLPYPPTQLWCVQVEDGTAGSDHLLLALHEDLYVARWLVHEPATPAVLELVGCQ